MNTFFLLVNTSSVFFQERHLSECDKTNVIQELFAGMFVLLTQLVMILKMEFFYKNVSKIQQLIRRLNGKLYQSRNAEEDM